MDSFFSNVTLLNMLMNAVWLALLICSIAMLSVVIERFIYFQIIKRKDNEFSEKIKSFLDESDYKSAFAYCQAMSTPLSNVVKTALNKNELSARERMLYASSREVAKIERFIPLLSTLSTVAPLLGLLGTILGMIESFSVIAIEGTGSSPALANGISNALLTTAAGLIIAIPSVLAYNYFVNAANSRISFMENTAEEISLKIK